MTDISDNKDRTMNKTIIYPPHDSFLMFVIGISVDVNQWWYQVSEFFRRSKHALLCAQHSPPTNISLTEGMYGIIEPGKNYHISLMMELFFQLWCMFWISIHKFAKGSHKFSCRKAPVEKSVGKHRMSGRNVVIIMASTTISNQLWDICTISWGCWNISK